MRLKLGVYEGRGMKGTVDTDFYRSQHYCYSMRYLRFLPSGRVHMLTSSDGIADALKLMMGSVATVKAQRKCSSNYVLDGTEVSFSIEARLLSHPNTRPAHVCVFAAGVRGRRWGWAGLKWSCVATLPAIRHPVAAAAFLHGHWRLQQRCRDDSAV